MSHNGNGDAPNSAEGDSDRELPWPSAEAGIRKARTVPELHDAMLEGLGRQREMYEDIVRLRAAYEIQTGHFALHLGQNDRIFATLKRIEEHLAKADGRIDDLGGQFDLQHALLQGIAAHVGVDENERERVLEDVRTLKRRDRQRDDADAQIRAGVAEAQRESLTAKERATRAEARAERTAEDTSKTALIASEKAATAILDAAAAKTELAITRGALQSHHDDDRAEDAARIARRAAKRATRWQIACGVILLVAGAVVGLAAKYLEPRAAQPQKVEAKP